MDAAWLKAQLDIHPEKSKAALARWLGLEPPAISKILAGDRQIKAQEYVAMRRFFGLPADGGGSLQDRKSYVLAPLTLSQMQDKVVTPEGETDNWVMPASLFETRTSAPPEKIRIFTVQENAMAPDIVQGERVLVDLSDIKPSPAGIFILDDGLGPIIRQCAYLPHSDPPAIRLTTRNIRYEPCTLLLEKAQIVGRVIAKLQWL